MTSLITIIVMIPVALLPKTGLDAYQPLGTTILGGLTIGTFLSLFDIPIMHTYIDDLTRWLNKTFLNRTWHWPITQLEDDASSIHQPSAATRNDSPSPAERSEGIQGRGGRGVRAQRGNSGRAGTRMRVWGVRAQ